MPKMKTHSSSKKRLSVTGSGKVKRNVANRAHKLTGKSSKRKMSLKQSAYVDSTSKNAVKKLGEELGVPVFKHKKLKKPSDLPI